MEKDTLRDLWFLQSKDALEKGHDVAAKTRIPRKLVKLN